MTAALITDLTSAAILTRSWPVGARVCTLTVPRPTGTKPQQACIEWVPLPPQRLTADEWRQYREGRNAALADLAREIGGNVALVEV